MKKQNIFKSIYKKVNFYVAKIKIIGGRSPQTINTTLTENQFSNTTNLFNIGNFNIYTNIDKSKIYDRNNELTIFSQPVTLETLDVKYDNIFSVINNESNKLILNFDKKNLLNYAQYGSLSDRLRVAIENIIQKWVGSLYIFNFDTNGETYNNVINYSYNELSNKATFKIPAFLIQNNFNLIFTNNSKEFVNYTDIKNLNYSYNKYEIFDINTSKTFKILDFIGSYNNSNGYITITVEGNIYPEAESLGYTSKMFHVKPNESEYNLFYSNLDSLEKYILSENTIPKYSFTVKVPYINEDDELYYVDKTYTWTTSDGYNIDVNNLSFTNYFNKILELGNTYDIFKTDMVFRMFLPSSVKNTDMTEFEKGKIFSRILGRELDEIKNFINGISYINNITYDKVENTPDILVKNLAKNLGWNNFNIIEVEDLFASIFNKETKDTGTSLTPVELDIELWRRILLNTNYLFKSKGTRKAIEAIFNFIGLPPCFIDLNEYVYTVNGKINPETVDTDVLLPLEFSKLPYDSEGYPVAFNETNDMYFQLSGNSDIGQAYIDVYRKLGFEVNKVVDNKKSWVYSSGATNRYDDFNDNITNYDIKESKLVLNTKEIGLNIDPIKAIECDIYYYNFNYNYPVYKDHTSTTVCNIYGSTPIENFTFSLDVLSGCTFDDLITVGGQPLYYPYPDRESNKFTVSGLTFNEYIHQVYSTFVNVQNRKTIDDGNGGGYPALTKLYYDYLKRSLIENGVSSNQYNLRKIFNYIGKFQSYYTKFFNQLLPATTIIEGQSVTYRNTIFTPQKFVYKRGIDEGSEFSIKQTTNLSDNITFKGFSNGGVILPIDTTIKIYESNANYSYTNGINNSPESTILTLKFNKKLKYNNTGDLYTFDIPQYSMFDFSDKIKTGITTNSIYYYDDVTTGKTINFIFTANTDSLSSTTLFNYKVYKYNTNINNFNVLPVYEKNIPKTSFSGGNLTILDVIPKTNLESDSEYLIKGYFESILPVLTANTLNFNNNLDNYGIFNKFLYPINKNAYNYYFDYTKYSGLTGYTISTYDNFVTSNTPYNIYDQETDWYFVSVGNPQKPTLLGLDDNNTTEPTCPFYIYESLSFNTNDEIILTYKPTGDIQLILNGLSLSKDVEFTKVNNLPSFLQDRVYKLVTPYSATPYTLTASYLGLGTSYGITSDTYSVSFIPSGSTQVLPYKVLYNTDINKYQFILDNQVSGQTNNVQFSINGSNLVPNLDYNLSVIDSKTITINDYILNTGDTITAYYVTSYTPPISTYIIPSNPFTFDWSLDNPINNQTGYFNLEFSTQFDTNFSSGLTISDNVDFVNNQQNFSQTIDFTVLPFNTLISNGIYNVRVKATKIYQTSTSEEFITYNYSDYKVVRVP